MHEGKITQHVNILYMTMLVILPMIIIVSHSIWIS
jgi:hypothetical protein